MDVFNSFDIASSALKAQRIRLDTISSNMANIETTRTPQGGPYQRKLVVFETKQPGFKQQLNGAMQAQGVRVSRIVTDTAEPRLHFDPAHPDANENGYVAMPNINLLEETADMMMATRAYEANLTSIKASKRMALKALEIGR
ncbi:MAG: flagellar basal body rod protein FlgC [Desulfuromonadaceae bacterium]|nr:flagellar basal body rod protein FlgC [Desulfuromonas sp.]MDY0184985.1 flagellar basal body rod protein FlgC [Desulfuromonadaceae bacterium]